MGICVWVSAALPTNPPGRLNSVRVKLCFLPTYSSRTVPGTYFRSSIKVCWREERMKVSYVLSFYYQLKRFTSHPIASHFLQVTPWKPAILTWPLRSLVKYSEKQWLRSRVLEKATFWHKAKWNNLCLVLKPHSLDVKEGLWVWGDSRNSVSIALYKWLPDVFVPTFFSWPPFQEMDWRSWQLIKNRFRVRKTNTRSAKLKSPRL